MAEWVWNWIWCDPLLIKGAICKTFCWKKDYNHEKNVEKYQFWRYDVYVLCCRDICWSYNANQLALPCPSQATRKSSRLWSQFDIVMSKSVNTMWCDALEHWNIFSPETYILKEVAVKLWIFFESATTSFHCHNWIHSVRYHLECLEELYD